MKIFFWLQKELVCFHIHRFFITMHQENKLSAMDNDSGTK